MKYYANKKQNKLFQNLLTKKNSIRILLKKSIRIFLFWYLSNNFLIISADVTAIGQFASEII